MTNHNHQAPPATLADEIREEGAGRPPGAVKRVNALADRVEAIEKENRDMERELNNAWGERDEAQHELDEAQADLRDVRNLLDQLSLGLSG